MSEAPEGRDSENNWVISSAESLLVETVGAAQGGAEAPQGREEDVVVQGKAEEPVQSGAEEAVAAGSVLAPPPDCRETARLADVKPSTQPIEGPTAQEEPKKPDEVSGPPPDTEGPRGPSTAGGDLEEVSCSSSDDDVEGLRKRAGRGAPPPLSVGPSIRETVQHDADAGSSFNLSTLVIAVIGLFCISILVFSGSSFNSDEDPTEIVMSRSVKGEDPPQVISDLQEWITQHADQFSGDPSSLQVMNRLLDKVAKENQEIRHMEAKLQAQKEELEAILPVTDGEKVTRAPHHPGLTEENVRLKDALLKEETAHLSAKEELQNLQEKLEVLESSHVEKEALMVENAQLKVDLDAFRRQIEGFLSQKETLVAESQMLRQELDKQRLLVSSIRQDLENLVTKTTEGEEEKLLQERLSEMSSRLAMEAQRSKTWEKTYVEHAQRRKEQVGELRRDHGHKEWNKADRYTKTSDTSTPGGDFRKTHYKHGKEHVKRWSEENQQESQHEEWRSKKHEHWKGKKHQHWEEERAKTPEETDTWKNKAKEHRNKDPAQHHHDSSKRQVRHHQGEAGDGFHPRKGQKEFTDRHKRPEDGEKGKEHRHHDHNKFWKKLSDHQYRVPVGCSGLEDCARKDGMDLFNVELKPVHRAQFEEVLLNYLAKTQLSENLPELMPLLDGFFEGPHFSHHKIRFKDFVDDVEDFLEDLARKKTGNDDIVDDFEKFVYTSFFGEAATKKRYVKKDEQQKTNKYDKPSGKLEKTYDKGLNQSDDRHSIHDNANPKNPGHQNIYKKQKSSEERFGKDSDKYKHKNPDKYNEDVEHKQYSDKHKKEANNKHYESSDPKSSRDGDIDSHRHRHPDHHEEDNKCKHRDCHHKHGEPEDSPRNHHQKNGKDQQRNYHQKYEQDKDYPYRYNRDHHKHGDDKDQDYHQNDYKDHHKHYRKSQHKYDKDHHKHEYDRDKEYHHKYDKNHHKHERDGEDHHNNDRDGKYHYKYNRDHHKHDKDGEFHHKYDKNYHEHDRDEDYHQKDNNNHHKHDRNGKYHHKKNKDQHKHDREDPHKYDKDHNKYEHDRDGEYNKDHHKHDREYQHKKDKDHIKHDRDYHDKYDKDHQKHDRDREYQHKKDKDHTKHYRDGDYHNKYDKDHQKHDRDGEYHHKKDNTKHDRIGDYQNKYDKDHHEDDRNRYYWKYKEGQDKQDKERR